MSRKQFRWLAGLLLVILVVSAAAAAIVLWLGPGTKDDRSTDLVTPTIAAPSARVFEVDPAQSQVDFVTQVRGLDLQGVFPVEAGTITLEPVGDELRALVRLEINVDDVSTGNPAVDQVLRTAMTTGDYPIAFYVASSEGLVPVTEQVITFTLDGALDVHNVPYDHNMSVEAQAVGAEIWAIAQSDLDLGNHGVEFPAIIGNNVIKLTARLQAYEGAAPTGTEPPGDS
ncbi:MAG: YceI family protein [Chloroflexi bacterium]|nr:YceI family protein [Chloroflexota bacterium]